MEVVNKIKRRLIERNVKKAFQRYGDVVSAPTAKGLEKGHRNSDGSTTLEGHPFRMPACMTMRENVVDFLWKDDVKLFTMTIYDVLGDVLTRRLQHLSPEVQELYNAFDRLRRAEKIQKAADRWAVVRDLLSYFLDTDLAYRWRIMWALKDVDWSKWAYTPEAAYWLSKRINVKPPLEEFGRQYVREWCLKNYGEIPKEFR